MIQYRQSVSANPACSVLKVRYTVLSGLCSVFLLCYGLRLHCLANPVLAMGLSPPHWLWERD